MSLSTINLTPHIGTQIKLDKEALLRGSQGQRLRELLAERCVLVFRDLYLEDEEQLVFAKTLGKIIPQGDQGLYKITLDPAESKTADLLLGTFGWHFDGTGDDVPPRASMLSPRRLSETGGQTEFANMYAAYEDLPASEKKLVDSLKVVHDRETLGRATCPNPTEAQLIRWRANPPKLQPLVWKHTSGRKSLVLGQKAKSVVGMDLAEGRALIDRLQAWATQPQYVYRHEWKMGDLLIWDNTGVIHRVEPYAMDSGRLLCRTTLAGEEALTGVDTHKKSAREAMIVGALPRIEPLKPGELGAEATEIAASMRKAVGLPPSDSISDSTATLLRHPTLYKAYAELARQVMNGTLTARDRELAILRVAWLCQAPFEWGEHVAIGKRLAGLTSEEIERITQGSAAPGFDKHDRAVLSAVEELHESAMISEETWRILADTLDEKQLIELPILVGVYSCDTYIKNSLRIRLRSENPGLSAR